MPQNERYALYCHGSVGTCLPAKVLRDVDVAALQQSGLPEDLLLVSVKMCKIFSKTYLQSSAAVDTSGLVNFVPALAYHLCLQHSRNLQRRL